MSEASYASFSKKLSEAVAKGDMKRDEAPPRAGAFLRIGYACRHCESHWVLSVPDQAFRGAWEEVK